MQEQTVGGNYLRVKEHIAELALAAGRAPQEITLVAISKNQPIEKILQVYQAGCRDIGESRVQELLEKESQFPNDLQVHMVGTLQKNKVNLSIGRFHLIHSVDTLELAQKLSQASQKRGIATRVLIQVNTSSEATKHGMSPEGWTRCLEKLLQLPHLSIEGLMTMASLTSQEKLIRESFASLRNLREHWRTLTGSHLLFPHLSMGMSNDYPYAIAEGATLLRIGTAIFTTTR